MEIDSCVVVKLKSRLKGYGLCSINTGSRLHYSSISVCVDILAFHTCFYFIGMISFMLLCGGLLCILDGVLGYDELAWLY